MLKNPLLLILVPPLFALVLLFGSFLLPGENVSADVKVPMYQTNAVQVDASLVERLREHNIKEIKVEPSEYGNPRVFKLRVNGEQMEFKNYSYADAAFQMYRLSVTSSGAKIFIREDGKDSWTPAKFAKLIEHDVSMYLDRKEREQQELALAEKSWS